MHQMILNATRWNVPHTWQCHRGPYSLRFALWLSVFDLQVTLVSLHVHRTTVRITRSKVPRVCATNVTKSRFSKPFQAMTSIFWFAGNSESGAPNDTKWLSRSPIRVFLVSPMPRFSLPFLLHYNPTFFVTDHLRQVNWIGPKTTFKTTGQRCPTCVISGL